MDYSGWLWAVLDIVGVLLLAAVMFYAGYQYRHRNRRLDEISEETTRRNYAEEDARSVATTPPDPLTHSR